MAFARFVDRLVPPSPNVLSYLEQINSQLQVALAAAPTESGSSFSTQLGTLTASRRNSKPFIVGFIPPDNEVNFIPVARQLQEVGSVGGATVSGVSGQLLPVGRLPEMGPEFQSKLIQICQELGIDPNYMAAAMMSESGLNPTAKNPVGSGAFGLIQWIPSEAKKVGTTGPALLQMSAVEQLDYVKKSFDLLVANGVVGRIGKSGDPLSDTYMCIAAPEYVGQNPNTVVFTAPAAGGPNQNQTPPLYPDGCSKSKPQGNFCQNRSVARGKNTISINDIVKKARDYYEKALGGTPIQVGSSEALVQPEDTPIAEERALMAAGGFTGIESDPIGDRIGRNIEIDADRLEVVAKQTEALRKQIDLIRSTPPLVMLINPSSFDRTYENAVDYGNKTRHGNVVQAWIERPMRISCSGVTAGQYVVDYEGAGGLTSANRVHSISYGNLLSLVNIYRNNGIIYSGAETGAEIGIPIVPFTIFIYYDNHVYLGSFDDFDVEDSDEKPFQMSYAFTFTTRYDQHLNTKLVDASVAASLQF